MSLQDVGVFLGDISTECFLFFSDFIPLYAIMVFRIVNIFSLSYHDFYFLINQVNVCSICSPNGTEVFDSSWFQRSQL